MKKISKEPDYSKYIDNWSKIYNEANYKSGLSSYFLSKSHAWAEEAFDKKNHFKDVLEVGGGNGQHVKHIRHTYDKYIISDLNVSMLENYQSNNPKIKIEQQDATNLSYEDNSFDRLIATHVLEHLPSPHLVIREWVRVLRPGGILTILLPCDPGMAWRLGRFAIPKRIFEENGIDYYYMMAREHINPISNLQYLINYYFPKNKQVFWRPSYIPSIDANLFYICHIKV